MSGNVQTRRLSEIAKTIRSKNAGVDKITFDIIFRDRKDYDLVRDSGAVNKKSMAALLGVKESRISDFVEYDPASAIKFTIYRSRPSGSLGDPDIFGAQQYAPLMGMEIPIA